MLTTRSAKNNLATWANPTHVWLNPEPRKGGPTSLQVVRWPEWSAEPLQSALQGAKPMKISIIKSSPAWITSTRDSSGGSGCFPKEGQERGWRKDGEGLLLCCVSWVAVPWVPYSLWQWHLLGMPELSVSLPCPWRYSSSHTSTHTVKHQPG